MNTFFNKLFFLITFTFLVNVSLFSQTTPKKDSTIVKKDTLKLRYDFKQNQKGGLFLDDLAKKTVIFDKELNRYVIVEKIGDYSTRTPVYLTRKEYEQYLLKRNMLQYFKDKVSATNSKKKGSKNAQRDLLPTYYVNSDFFETIFGGNTIKVTPTGSLNLKLGFIYQNTENPQLSEENRSSFVFDFDQQINMSLRAKVGERLEFTANYDTQSTFDFQNLVKIDYTPTEDDILQGIEAGNISMPIKNSLINGAQSLFGVKTQLQFGKTKVTAVFSQQNSESNTVVAEGGASIQPFELRATDYDTDRHFFLSQYFIDNYANSLKNYPLINSQINVTRIEVWITNRNASTEDFRSIVAFADIGESKKPVMVNQNVTPSSNQAVVSGGNLPFNEANNIYEANTLSDIRNISTVETSLRNRFGMEPGTDYSTLENARKLDVNEYTLNPQLGFISLNRRLNDGEVLAVAYEYTVAGTVTGSTKKSFKVGEFSNDGVQSPENLAVKLLRSEILQTKRTNLTSGEEEAFPTWRLMMKNVYALGAFPLSRDGFRFEIQYRDDQTGIPSNTLQNAQTTGISTTPLIQVLRLDQLDQTQFRSPDGFFDYVEGVTVNSQNGYIFFPEPEPFGKDLVKNSPNDNFGLDENVDEAFLFKELYLNTKINIQNNFQNKDKYFLKGYFKSENSGGIPIGGFNVPRGSVTVTAGGRQLVEGVDFVVDYNLGRVQIIDPGLKASGTPISVSTENNAVFNQQRKTFMGIDVEHQFSEKFTVGATVLNVMERPLTPKVNFGADPINNTMFGANIDYSTEVPYFTKLANKLPFVDTDVTSNLSIRADMAYLLPGTPSGIDVAGAATSYIDDFEASQIPISLISPLDWYEASTPKYFPNFNGEKDDLSYNYKRAKLAWYSVDQIFYGFGDTPNSVDADELSRAETRQINFNELFPNQQLDITQNAQIRTLDLAYFPSERGSYNFNPNATFSNDKVELPDPETNWGGIMRPLNTNNFDVANVEYIQFWVMDPYQNYSLTTEEGLPLGLNPADPNNQIGDLYINLGNVSEDILKDNRKMYENGLPELGGNQNTDPTRWGIVPTNPSIIYAFSEDDAARLNQDVGFDGITDEDEKKLTGIGNYANLVDPAADNFRFFRGSQLDAANASIITRYKDFNNPERNSPTLNQSPEPYPTSATTYPDVEDINRDQTMNTVESYFQYKISMNKNDLVKGKNFVVDEKTTTVTLENGNKQETKWYQFRVPIRSGTPVNGIADFNSIRFIRMFLTNFKMPVVIRFGELDLVRGDWRRYVRTLDPNIDPDRDLTQNELNDFEVGVVSIEQNEGSYIQPPGIERERLQGSTTVQLQNEQSVSLKVNNLPANSVRAIYKNISVDLRRFKNLQMFMHLQKNNASDVLADDDLVGIIRLGTDLNENFYQIEVPLKVSTSSATALDIWPEANNLDAFLENFGKVKLERDALGNTVAPINKIYTSTQQDPNTPYTISVKGNPTLAQLRTIMLGLKNTSTTQRSGEIWFNELRSSGFDNKGGWAAVVNADANFADVANVSLTGSMKTIGFGNVEDRVNQRSLDETKEYDVSTSINLGKVLTPKKWGIQLPMTYSIGERFIDPKFDPQYQDVKLKDAIAQNPNSEFSRDYTKRTSISFTNVKKNRNPNSTKKPRFYDVENLAVSYAHNKEFHRDYNVQKRINENVRASASYNHTFSSKPIEPFKNLDSLKGKYWQLLKDFNFNPIPKTLAINSSVNRSYNEQQSRNLVPGLLAQPELKQRRFLFDWDYTVGFDLTKSLQLNFNATNSYIYDAFGNGEELQVFDNFFNTGRPNQYHQKLNATYNIPINKIPFLKFIKADYAYTADFDWQAAPQGEIDINGVQVPSVNLIGNVIQNANTHNLNTTINFDRFYKSLGFERLLLSKSQRKNTKGLKGNGLPPTPGRINQKKKLSIGKQILKGTYDLLTSVKQGKISYSENNGQLLPGFVEDFGFLGGPTTGFAFGSQVDIRNKALENGWLVGPRDASNSEYFNKTYSKTHYNKLDYTFTLKPFKDLNIDVRGNKIKTRDYSQQLDVIDDGSEFGIIDTSISVFETGNFSTSHSMISTAFSDSDALFQKLRNYRVDVSKRLATQNGIDLNNPNTIFNPDGTVSGFGGDSQQVLLPAFMAAYSGENPDKVSTGLFRNIPIPNWTLRYNGLMKFKFFKKNFSNFVVSHGYRSSYTVSSFTNNLLFDGTSKNTAGNFEPELLVSAVTLVDEFSPLIKLDMKMRNSFSLRGEVKRDRTLTMNFNNSTLTDIKGTEYIFGLGYVFKDVKLNTRFTGKKTTLKGDINLRADVSLRDNITQIRSVTEDNNQISGGQKLFSIKFTADYRLSSNLTASFYYNHQNTSYAISTTFPRQAINGGFNIIYNLGGN
ncbi:T9SS outer membrane translocon Sov/SprA [Polaribacter aquimarinus]|uniref:Cell surface protein SprA n=1 Tax=Polaribacter aquimarinus TaxID=2100726 RepID=A0A2U2JBV7_9FLAO|nr:cell surface protein SprA [Polaribacter aquimarinus]PWG05761.1 cell surface protein SprA [Polaribacter aquimarinus]